MNQPVKVVLAGNGGSGKSTCAALLARGLIRAGIRPVLAVDADPFANLHVLLGVAKPPDLGGLRDELKKAHGGTLPPAKDIEPLLDDRIRVGEGVDLIAMGLGKGPGCYCSLNDLLRQSMSRHSGRYRAILVDNPGGTEHLSRRNMSSIDHLVLVSDPSPRGLHAVVTIRDLIPTLDIRVGKTWIVWNRAHGPGTGCGAAIPDGLTLLAEVPYDPSIPGRESKGESLLVVTDDSPAASALAPAARRLV